MSSEIPLRKRILFRKFDEYVNMSSAQMRQFWTSPEAQKVSQTPEESFKTGGLAGKQVTREIANMISKAAKYRGQLKKLPPWSDREWLLCGSIVRYIARIFYGNGDLVDSNGERLPRALAPMYWGFDILKRKTKLPRKEEIKKEVKDYVKKETLKESFFDNLLDL